MSDIELVPPTWPEYSIPLSPEFEWTPIDRNAPTAFVRLKQMEWPCGASGRRWVVVRCPYCGEQHDHFAGQKGSDPRAYLGGRLSHCEPGGEYRLVHIKIKTESREAIAPSLRADVWDKTRGKCWYCGVDMHPFRNYHVDHFIPVSDGGSNDLSNLVPSCQSCNQRKHARPAEYLRRFLATGRFYGEDPQ